MPLTKEILKHKSIFLDTAPIIYYIEAHSIYGKMVKDIVYLFQNDQIHAFSSVITITEVIPKPISENKQELVDKFLKFLRNGKNFQLININDKIAERAGILRGKYKSLRTMDAIKIAAAIELGTKCFVTNDKKLKIVNEIPILILTEYQ